MLMPAFLNLVALIVIVGVVMWLINAYIPMPPAIKTLLNVVVLILLVIYILQFFGLINPILPTLKIFH